MEGFPPVSLEDSVVPERLFSQVSPVKPEANFSVFCFCAPCLGVWSAWGSSHPPLSSLAEDEQVSPEASSFSERQKKESRRTTGVRVISVYFVH